MLRTLFPLLLFISIRGYAQTISPARQIALNNYVEYANRSAQEVGSLFNRIVSYYPQLKRDQSGKSYVAPFNCADQLDNYYFNEALSKGSALGNATILNAKVKDLRGAAETLDEKCKALDTYYKLKDYQQDKFERAEILVSEMQAALAEYRQNQTALANEIESTYRKLQTPVLGNPYHAADRMMKQEISRERAFLDSWNFNLNEELHTGWPLEKLQSSILETEKAVAMFTQAKPSIKYPASGMYGSFVEALGSILSVKRSGLDGYNFEAKKSDKHSNQVYLDLINYFNGTLVANQNMFVQYAVSDDFYGVKSINYVPYFGIRSVIEQVNNEVKPFQDILHTPLKIIAQPAAIPKPVFDALGNYIEFINEALRQMRYLHDVLRNYNASAMYYKDLTSYKGRGGLTYNHANFQIPLSIYQMLVTQSSALPPAYRRPLNEQAEVLLNILKEMDELSIALTLDAKEKRYEKDNLKKAYEILVRNAALFEIADPKKEQLYRDVRGVYESYPTPDPTGSWEVSNKALLALVDEDRVQLFKAKAFFRGDSSSIPTSSVVDPYLRDVIAKEFTNMKGIERYGRSNGLCPYTPYEDIPETSRTLSEKIKKIKSARSASYEGPYHDFVYLYNVIIDNYNKFCELAKMDFLKDVRQPELYYVKYPEKKPPPREKEMPNEIVSNNESKQNVNQGGQEAPSFPGRTVDTVKATSIGRPDTRQLDTVYIEKHDTIYMGHPGENPMSMEGYAANNLVFLLDVSGSMNAGQKLPLLKKSMLVLLNMLRTEDQVSVVVYSGKARVALPPTSAQETEKIRRVIENLRSEGETNGNAGIKLAYKVANGNYIRTGNNRIVLATDGEFPISEETMNMVSRFSNEDIFLSVFNFGKSTASEQNLEKLSLLGKGHYEYITRENSDRKLIQEAKGKRKK